MWTISSRGDRKSLPTVLVFSFLMITTVKNSRGYRISVLNVLISLTCAGFILYYGYIKYQDLRSRWFVRLGFATSFSSCLHQILLLVQHRAYTRLHFLHKVLVLLNILSFVVCFVLPTLVTGEYAALNDDNLKSAAFYLFITYAVNLVPLYFLSMAILYSNSQRAQNLLHPFTEIIDGFVKSSGSIQMTSITSSSNLKQVVVVDGDNNTANVSADSVAIDMSSQQESEAAEFPASHKADGSSPKPSKVLKTWPKADPFPVRALYSFKPTSTSELPFKKGDTIIVLDCRGRWWQAQKDDRIGFIPSNYVTVLLKARVTSTFAATVDDQVSVKKDEIIEVMEKYDEKCLVRNVEDKIGAIPTSKLEFIYE